MTTRGSRGAHGTLVEQWEAMAKEVAELPGLRLRVREIEPSHPWSEGTVVKTPDGTYEVHQSAAIIMESIDTDIATKREEP